MDHNATAGADPYCSLGITPPSSSYRADDDDGKRRSPEAARLIAAVRSAVGCGAIWGAPAAQLVGLVDEQPERTDWLCQLAARVIPGTRSPARAVILLREAIAAGEQPDTVPGVDVDRRRRNLVDLIATYRTLGEDAERVSELESQLADLGATYDG